MITFIKNTKEISKLWKKDTISNPNIKNNIAKTNIKIWKSIINTVNNFY